MKINASENYPATITDIENNLIAKHKERISTLNVIWSESRLQQLVGTTQFLVFPVQMGVKHGVVLNTDILVALHLTLK